MVKRCCCLLEDDCHSASWHRMATTGLDLVGQGTTRHVRHDKVGQRSRLIFIHSEDMGMVETSNSLGLAIKTQGHFTALLMVHSGDGGQNYLNSYLAVQVRL